ncbi:Conserved_hypothetical protein [Hexamita inflata]|uniref:Uncharacterized protein n=1 Tax=Hexamita inflata TaxID=28002 RepID=A0AA86NKR7_9EUKA|nr:Conserved hypothetical protein [Hexamita inflata]
MSTTFASKVNSNKFAQPAVLDETALKYKDCVRNAYLTISDDSSIANLNFAKQLNIKSLYLVQCFNITISQAVLVELSIVKCQLSSIQGIGQMKSLQKLNLSQNLIMDFSELSQLENLLHLNLSNSSLEEISFLSGLVKITHLNLNFNIINNISVLQNFTHLVHLGVGNNKLTSIVCLKSCQTLQYLDVQNTQLDVASIDVILNLPKLKEFIFYIDYLDKDTQMYCSQINENKYFDLYYKQFQDNTCSSWLKVYIDQTVNSLKFLQRINKEKLIKKLKVSLYYNEQQKGRQMFYSEVQCNKMLRFFEEQLTELTEVYINYSNSISPEQLSCNHFEGIENFQQLKVLKVKYSPDWDSYREVYCRHWSQEAIKGKKYSFSQQLLNKYISLTSIQELTLIDLEIESVESLKQMIQLVKLTLQFNQISDIQYLSDLTNLIELNLSYNRITDIQAVKEMKKLTKLCLSYNRISNIEYIRKLTNLTELYLSYNKISDINALQLLNNLEMLFLQQNQIVDIQPLSRMHKLKYLYVQNNYIVDVQPISMIIIQQLRQQIINKLQNESEFENESEPESKNENELVLNVSTSTTNIYAYDYLSNDTLTIKNFVLSDNYIKNVDSIYELLDKEDQIYEEIYSIIKYETLGMQNDPTINQMLRYKMIQSINSSQRQLAHTQQRFKRTQKTILTDLKSTVPTKLNQLNKEFSKNVQNLFKQCSSLEIEVDQ